MNDFPFYKLTFNKKAKLVDQNEWQSIEQAIAGNTVTDLIVLSHGWNNDMAEATDLYNEMLNLIRAEIEVRNAAGRTFAVVGIYWPSKKFADRELIPGGAAFAVANEENAEAILECQQLEVVTDPEVAAQIADLRMALERKSDADEISTKMTRVLNSVRSQEMEGSREEQLGEIDQNQIYMILADEEFFDDAGAQGDIGGAMDVEGGIADGEVMALGLGGGLIKGVRTLLNVVTYYTMKDRAGIIGRKGLNPLLREIKEKDQDIRIHLVGHSFGARLVSSAILGDQEGEEVEVASLSLLQAAFSHYSFAREYDENVSGAFRPIIDKKLVKGPFLITHTYRDTAVRLAYAVASRLAGQVGAAVGDENDFYGGLGGNGAQRTTEAVNDALLAHGANYTFEPEKIYNLRADDYIWNHSDIKNPATAGALVSAFLS